MGDGRQRAAPQQTGTLSLLRPEGTELAAVFGESATLHGTLKTADGQLLPVTLQLGAPARAGAPLDDAVFRLRLELDIEHERQVLYRALLVLEGVGLLVLIRQWLLGG